MNIFFTSGTRMHPAKYQTPVWGNEYKYNVFVKLEKWSQK